MSTVKLKNQDILSKYKPILLIVTRYSSIIRTSSKPYCLVFTYDMKEIESL